MSKRFPTIEATLRTLNTEKLVELDEHFEMAGPWTEWSEYCKQIGFEPHQSDSNDPVVRLLEPLYDQIKQLADQEAEQVQAAKQNGQTYSLDWSQVWINLHTRMNKEQQERRANDDDQMYFEVHNRPCTYVWINGKAYHFDSLLQALEEIQSEGLAFNNCRVQPTYHRLLVDHQLANMDLSGYWHANVATLDMFIEQLYNTHERWKNNGEEDK